VVNTASGAIISTFNVGNSIPIVVHHLAVSPDGGRLYVPNSFENNVWVMNAFNGTVITKVPAGSVPLGAAVRSDGSLLYVTNLLSDTVSGESPILSPPGFRAGLF